MEISASKITTYLDCPLKYKFKYIDRIEPEEIQPGLALGSSFHRTIKHFYKRLMEGQNLTTEQLEAAFRQDWEVAQTIPISWNGESPEQLERQGLELLKAYISGIGEAPSRTRTRCLISPSSRGIAVSSKRWPSISTHATPRLSLSGFSMAIS